MQEMQQTMDLHRRNLPRRLDIRLRMKCPSRQWKKRSRTKHKTSRDSLLNFDKNTCRSSNVPHSYLSGQATRTRQPSLPKNSLRESRTKTNIELARKAKGISSILAITANPESPLARECDETLQLQYRTTGILTSGTTSFTTSLLACALLLRNLPRTIQAKTTPNDTRRLSTSMKQAGKGAFVFTGSGVNYALSLYGAAKINEVLGAKAEAAYPEQLGHAKLFSIDKKRDFVVSISSGRDKAKETHQLLTRDGFQTSILTFPDSSTVNGSLRIAIYLQRIALSLARRKGLKECVFLSDKSRLNLSNRMIY